jgi:hypothetical protein
MKKGQKEYTVVIPHPDKVLILISKTNWNSLFSKWIKTKEGKDVELFTDIAEDEGFERRFQQNVSVGKVIGTGANVYGVKVGDMAIIDYLVTGNNDYTVGFVNGERIVAVDAVTTYHEEDSPPNMNGRNAYVIGDYDNLSPLYGVVRDKKVIPRNPYVFLVYENPLKLSVSEQGLQYEEMDKVCTRKVLGSHEESICQEGDTVVIKEGDLFERVVDEKILSIIFEQEIIAVK